VPGMLTLANLVVVVFILGFLVVLNPLRALVIASALGLGYVLVYSLMQRRMARYGDDSVQANKERFQLANEALGGVKEIKLLGRENAFLDNFATVSRFFSRRMALGETLTNSPRYILDTIAFGSLLGMMIVLYVRDASQVIPVVGIYAFAGYRLMPALQQIYRNITKARFHTAVLATIKRDLEASSVTFPDNVTRLAFQDRLELDSISFKYPTAKETLLQNLSLSIKKNSSVAFVGATGSGKTTIVDILLGLLPPSQGQLLVDQQPLTANNLRNWQANLGYVPQTIFLSDGTIAQNIAFGIQKDKLDMNAVVKAATIANLHEFIEGLRRETFRWTAPAHRYCTSALPRPERPHFRRSYQCAR
jgi:ATP-binding cassette, subfamily B, bacterial PglK